MTLDSDSPGFRFLEAQNGLLNSSRRPRAHAIPTPQAPRFSLGIPSANDVFGGTKAIP